MPTYADVIECVQRFTLQDGQDAVNVFHFSFTDTLDLSAATIFADLIHASWHDNLRSHTNDQITFADVTVTDIRTVGGPQFVVTYDEAGSSGTDALPQFVAALVSWKTNTRTRAARGRSYLVGFVEGSSSGQQIEATTYAAIVAWADQMSSGGSGLLTILSKTHNQLHLVTGWDVNHYWKRMSRREVRP